MPSFETAAAKSRLNIFKATSSALWVAPMTSPLITDIYDATSGVLSELPEGYQPLGWADGDDGITWGRETEVSEVIGHGSAYPVRSDITKDTTTFQAKLLEINAATLGLTYQVQDVASTGLDYENKAITVDQALTPPKLNYRFLAIGRDGAGPSAIYYVRFLPSATITEYGDNTWNNEDAQGFDVTLTAEPDDEAGYAVRNQICGPGLTDGRLTAMGFTVPAPTP